MNDKKMKAPIMSMVDETCTENFKNRVKDKTKIKKSVSRNEDTTTEPRRQSKRIVAMVNYVENKNEVDIEANDSSTQNETEFTGEVLGVEFDNFFSLNGDDHDCEQPLENEMKCDRTTHQSIVDNVSSFKGEEKCQDFIYSQEEDKLYHLIIERRAYELPCGGDFIRKTMNQFVTEADETNPGEAKPFKASQNWLTGFCRRKGIVLKRGPTPGSKFARSNSNTVSKKTLSSQQKEPPTAEVSTTSLKMWNTHDPAVFSHENDTPSIFESDIEIVPLHQAFASRWVPEPIIQPKKVISQKRSVSAVWENSDIPLRLRRVQSLVPKPTKKK